MLFRSKLNEVQPVESAVFKLEYLDASDVAEAVKGLLSKRGTVTVVKKTGQTGWEFGEGESGLGKRKKVRKKTKSRSKVLLVNDIPSHIEKVREVIEKIDNRPKQVLIEARIMEVNHDKLKDIGIDWGTGSTGAQNDKLEYIDLNKGNDKKIGSQILNQNTTVYDTSSGISPGNTGLKVSFKKLSGAEFEAILHALKEDVEANTLSAPRILTLDNQEASILVGQKYPIVKSETSTETSQITGGSLEYYQDIGIQLNVIPKICGKKENYINMILHPAVTSKKGEVSIKEGTGDNARTLVSYPYLTSRETETQVLVRDGQTVVIGGLLKNVKSKGVTKVPLLGDIPLLGLLFQRQTTDKEKVDLLIFITATIVEEPDLKKAERKKFKSMKGD